MVKVNSDLTVPSLLTIKNKEIIPIGLLETLLLEGNDGEQAVSIRLMSEVYPRKAKENVENIISNPTATSEQAYNPNIKKLTFRK
ncbi:hypothetical protein CACET_c07080 [Clostridium aceticum]|uniref:Uncharacterized protein n=1 Tax=Clostridium aceticum TaxID=84022 RepID=A0A0D8IDR1_9CLOT|nr:hypothetical protein [Clostridium aceticum]AKL94218.1 hypothetical protein CACET_c07080 [Clostridium aceticum]KJF28445.1 hypothetical protein TZ02_00485 [Clostridium aceticum]